MTNAFYRFIAFVFFISLLTVLSGCGGGGGSSATAVSPAELEVQAILDSFAGAVRAQNLTAVMENFDTNLKYYPANPAIPSSFEDFVKFRDRVNNFFTKAVLTEFSLTSNGISAGMEDVAMARAELKCVYKLGTASAEFTEQIEMKLERVSKWGIIEIYRYDSVVGQTGMTFPPEL